MSSETNRTFGLEGGMDTYGPPITVADLMFTNLYNIEPRLNRLISSLGYTEVDGFLSGGDFVRGFYLYTQPDTGLSDFYLFTKSRVRRFNFSTQTFGSPIYSTIKGEDAPYVFLPWFDGLYFTKPGSGLLKVKGSVVTMVDPNVSAAFGVVVDGKIHLANVSDDFGYGATRTRWSDRDAPGDFVINPTSSEADFYELDPPSIRITGETNQRGRPTIYTETDIFIATPVGFPGGFRTEPLHAGVGNVYPYAVIHNKDVDFFIGRDGFYALSGTQLIPIGKEIWETFRTDVKDEDDPKVYGYLDSAKGQAFWVYTATDDSSKSIVFNYRENKWSFRDGQKLTSFFDAPLVPTTQGLTYDDLSGTYDDIVAGTTYDNWARGETLKLKSYAGVIFTSSSTDYPFYGTVLDRKVKFEGNSFAHAVETFDFVLDDVLNQKEFLKLTLQYAGAGSPNLTLKVGRRNAYRESITWSSAISPASLDDDLAFFFRSSGVGKFIRFKLEWNNSADNYVTELVMLTISNAEK